MPGPSADVFLPSGGTVASRTGKTIAGIPRTWFFVGVAVAAVIVFVVLRNRSSTPAAAATTPTVTGDGSTVPATSSTDTGAGGAPALPAVDPSQVYSNLIGGYDALVSELLGAGATVPTSANTAQHVVSGQANGGYTPYVNSYNPGTIFAGPGGRAYAYQPGGFQPAYVGPSGSFVSPGTYLGLGVQPQPITSSEVAPPRAIPGPSLRGGTRLVAS